jgi:hypothetical protein
MSILKGVIFSQELYKSLTALPTAFSPWRKSISFKNWPGHAIPFSGKYGIRSAFQMLYLPENGIIPKCYLLKADAA